MLLEAVAAAPVLGLMLEEGADGAEVALVAQEEGALLAVAPEPDRVRERVHGLPVPADEGAAEVDVREPVLLGLQICDLADVVAVCACTCVSTDEIQIWNGSGSGTAQEGVGREDTLGRT